MPIVGTNGPDTLQNGDPSVPQVIEGLGGDDSLIASSSDTLEGGQGDDILTGDPNYGGAASYEGASGPVYVSLTLTGPQNVGADQGVDTLVHITNLIGSAYNDTLLAGPNDGGPLLTNIDGGDGADSILGGLNSDFLIGGAGNDTINASASGANVAVDGGPGDDIIRLPSLGSFASWRPAIHGGDGNDQIYSASYAFGGNGDDTITATATPVYASLSGDAGNDSLVGSANTDILGGGSGNNTIDGGGGADTINVFDVGDYGQSDAAYRNDLIHESGSNALLSFYSAPNGATVFLDLSAGTGHVDEVATRHPHRIADLVVDHINQVLGSFGGDTILGSAGSDSIEGGYGNDVLTGGPGGCDTLSGGAGDDSIVGGSAGASIWGGDGDDTIVAAAGGGFAGASIWGGAGHDSIVGTAGSDEIHGSGAIDGGGGSDTIFAGAGVISNVGPGSTLDFSEGYSERLTADMGSGTATLIPVPLGPPPYGQVTFSHFDRLIGTSQADSVLGSASADFIDGRPGDDTLVGAGGMDTLHGGDGNDSIMGGSTFDQINGNKGDDTIIGQSAVGDWLLGGQGDDSISAAGSTGHNLVNGNLGDDTIQGGSGGDSLRGGQGDDQIVGGSGADWISGDMGHDTLTGGAGADIFHVAANNTLTVITDFNFGQGDRLLLDWGAHYTISASGSDTLIVLDSGAHVILQNITASSLPPGAIF